MDGGRSRAAASAWLPPRKTPTDSGGSRDGLYDGAPVRRPGQSLWPASAGGVDARAIGKNAGALALGLRDYGVLQLAGVLATAAGDSHAAMVG